MAEISVQFKNQLNGYNKAEVDQFLKVAEAKLEEKAIALASAQQQVADLEARLNRITSEDASVEEKIVLYDKLMKKMDGDYTNLLAPAIAKARQSRHRQRRSTQSALTRLAMLQKVFIPKPQSASPVLLMLLLTTIWTDFTICWTSSFTPRLCPVV